MLINFSFENFRSFEGLTKFTMTPGGVKKHKNNLIQVNDDKFLLRYAGVYGANAAGKSNFIAALRAAKNLVISKNANDHIWNGIYDDVKGNKSSEMTFDFDIQINEKIYGYGFTVESKDRIIVSEWLYDLTETEIPIYTKKNDELIDINYDLLNLSKEDSIRMKVYVDDYGNESGLTFLSELNRQKRKIIPQNGYNVFEDIYNWFKYTLEVITPESTPDDFALSFIDQDITELLENYLKVNDTGIKKVEFNDIAIEKVYEYIPKEIVQNIQKSLSENLEHSTKRIGLLSDRDNMFKFIVDNNEVLAQQVTFIHSNDKKLMYHNESDGTKRLIDLFTVLTANNPKVFFIDEIDRSLHPILAYSFVKDFLEINKNTQLIVTTHEDRLMDLKLLRRDQIWFINKCASGISDLYSLEEYKPRFDTKINKAYMEGRYGAIPELTEFIEGFKASLNKKGNQ